jgi:hypothetical protein
VFPFGQIHPDPSRILGDMADSWYRRKSQECGRMAQSVTDSDLRDRYKNEEKLWLQIADQEDKNDAANSARIALRSARADTK